jgi:hypothetical protein
MMKGRLLVSLLHDKKHPQHQHGESEKCDPENYDLNLVDCGHL